jgi:hypothetical protein
VDYVYVCRSGDNEELRYSIRSVRHNASYNNLWVVGGKPDWYYGNFVEVPDVGNKFQNIQECYKAITQIGAISNEFVLMNDDFFILKPVGIMPILHGGPLIEKIERYNNNGASTKYTRILLEAYKKMQKLRIKDPLDYDIHTPMVIEKNKIKDFIDLSLAPRSMYGNMFNIGGENIQDVKIYSSKKMQFNSIFDYSNLAFLSTEDESFDKILPFLDNLFPKKSMYELF